MAGVSYSVAVAIQGGQIVFDRAPLIEAVRSWADGEATLTLSQDEPKRSTAANRYLFGVVYRDIEEYTGQSKEDIHDEMCVRFTSETIHYVNPATGEMVEMTVVRRTSGMSVSRFHRFVQDVKLFAGEFFGLTFEDAPAEFYQERDRAAEREARKQEAS